MTDNELIAEFMGLQRNDRGEYFIQDYPHIHASCFAELKYLMYHESWDWLMPVVEKIERLFQELPAKSLIHPYNNVLDITICEPFSRVYEEVVEFIKWYNENKKP